MSSPTPDRCDHSMDLGVRCLTCQEVSKRDSTNSNQLTGELMTSNKTLGALTGLLVVALVVVAMGWCLPVEKIQAVSVYITRYTESPSISTNYNLPKQANYKYATTVPKRTIQV